MLPEQSPLPKKPEEIVQSTGWGFLIPPSTELSKLISAQVPPVKPDPSDAPPPSPANK